MSEKKCPLFSEKLELHMVEVGNGLRPNAGSFCDFCFNPVDLTGSKINKCTNCNKNIVANNTVISRCGQYAVACNIGGKYNFNHCTFANYWNYSNRYCKSRVETPTSCRK